MHNINLRDSYIISLQDGKIVDVSTNDQHIIPDFGYQGMTELTVRGYSESSQEKTVDSSTVGQEVTPDQGYTSLKKVTVNPYELDSSVVVITNNGRVNVTSEKDGLSSVDINVSVSPILQYKEVDSSTNEQSVVADSQYQGLSQVKINPYELDSKNVDSSTNIQVIVSDKDGLSQVTVNPYVLDSSSATIEKNGTYQFTSENDGLSSVTVDVSIDSRVPQSKTVDSSTNSQEVIPDEGYNALDKVIVNPYELDSKTVDSSTNTQTVVSDKDGLSSVTVNPYVLDSKTVDPSTNDQIITSDEDGLSSVTVNKVTSGIDPNIAQGNIKKDVTILGITGTLEGGDLQEVTVDSSTNSQVIKPGQDYFGLSQVTVNPYELDSKIVDSSTNEQTVVSDKDGLSSVTVNPYVLDSKTVDPSTNQQVITPEHDGLSQVTINAVNSSIDPNIQPENIVNGVNILGVEGTADSIVYPEEIKRFEYFQTNGDLFFDTGIIPDTSLGVIFKGNQFKGVSGKSDVCHGTGYYDSTTSSFGIQKNGPDDHMAVYGSSNYNNWYKVRTSDVHIYKYEFSVNGNMYGEIVDLNQVMWNQHKTVNPVTTPFGILGHYYDADNTQYRCAVSGTKVCYFEFYREGVTIAKFWPSIDSSNNYCLYDEISENRIYPKDPSVTFSVGPEILPLYKGGNLQGKVVDSSTVSQLVRPDSPYVALMAVEVNPYRIILQDKTVTPSDSQQSITKDSGYDGLGTVTVNAITSSIDPDIVPIHILRGINILGVEGELYHVGSTPIPVYQYMQTDGSCFFDTLVTVKPTTKIVTSWFIKATASECLFGTHAYANNGGDSVEMRFYWTGYRTYLTTKDTISGPFKVNDQTVEVGNNYILIGGERSSGTAFTETSTATIGIFGGYTNAEMTTKVYAPAGNRVHNFKIYEGDTLIKSLYPVKDTNDVYCLYDVVNNQFYYNLGEGTVSVGSAIDTLYV